nr:hypothetical protein [Tanacetum cinerariifolium]
MSNNNAGTPPDIKTDNNAGSPPDIESDIESKQATIPVSNKAPNGKPKIIDIKRKQVMVAKGQQASVELFLDQLQVDVTGTIVVMIGRKWDVNAVTGRYLSTNFMVSDVKMLLATSQTNHSIIVTLWGGLGDILIEKKTKHVDMCPVVVTSTSAKFYNNKLYLSSSSSTMIFDDPEIPNPSFPVDLSQPMVGTIENLLMWARNHKNDSATFHCQLGQWWCDACNTTADYPVLRYRLELDVADDTGHTVVVLFDEPATALIKCFAESLAEADDEVNLHALWHVEKLFSTYLSKQILNDDGCLPIAISNIIGTFHVLEIKSHTYYEYGTFESFTCWKVNLTEGVDESIGSSTLDVEAGSHTPKLKRMKQDLFIPNPSKPIEEGKIKGLDTKDFDTEARGVSGEGGRKGKAAHGSDRMGKNILEIKDPDWKKGMVQVRGLAKKRFLLFLMLSDMCLPSQTQSRHLQVGNFGTPAVAQYTLYPNRNKPCTTSRTISCSCGQKTPKGATLTSAGVSAAYHNMGPPLYQCHSCKPVMHPFGMKSEMPRQKGLQIRPSPFAVKKVKSSSLDSTTPPPLKTLLDYNEPTTSRFKDQIRVYN